MNTTTLKKHAQNGTRRDLFLPSIGGARRALCAFKALAGLLLFSGAVPLLTGQAPDGSPVTLPHHVIAALSNATHLPRTEAMNQDTVTLTVVLNLSDEAGHAAFAAEMKDPASPNYRKSIGIEEFKQRFGPTQEAYDAVLAYLEKNGFILSMGSVTRRTITVTGTRAQAEKAFHVNMDDYLLGDRTFHAVASDPSVPADLAPFISSVFGLSNLARWRSAVGNPTPEIPQSTATAYDGILTPAGTTNSGNSLPPGLDGTGQTIGLVEYSGYYSSDLSNTFAKMGLPSNQIKKVSIQPIGTPDSPCTPDPGTLCGSSEVLLDIAAVAGIAPGANVVVFEGPMGLFGSDFASTLDLAASELSGYPGGGALSLSWLLCEGEIGASDVTSIESQLQEYASFGVTLFASSGDTGSTCSGGGTLLHWSGSYPNAVSFPSDAPSTISVGGTHLTVDSGNVYFGENWWDESASASGGFGVSQYVAEPSYQTSFYPGATGRSVPDVAAESSPGIIVCEATTTDPTFCGPIGGTSLAAPLWAGIWALAQQAHADAGGSEYNGSGSFLYGKSDAFHAADTMGGPGGDFQHVGLGTPDITMLIAKTVPPKVNSFSPASGSAAGGTTVTVNGTGFIGVEKVTFGGAAITDFTVYSDKKLTFSTPAASSETATIAVVTPGGTSTASGAYTFVPQITGVSPNVGPIQGGGAWITVTGYALSSSLKFAFGGTPATDVTCSSSKTCTLAAPAHAAGKVDVVAEGPDGNSATSSADQFTYQGLSITRFTPTTGPTTGGTELTIYGYSLSNDMVVSFGGVNVTGALCSSDGTGCFVASPPHAVGAVYLTVSVSGLTSAPSPTPFTYAVFPTVTGISPAAGPTGTTVTVTGTGFIKGTGQTSFVMYGGANPANCSSTTQCTVVIPDPYEMGWSSGVTEVQAYVNGLVSADWVLFTDDSPPPLPKCKVGTCM